jgi:pyrroloquinoline-quinone synthase
MVCWSLGSNFYLAFLVLTHWGLGMFASNSAQQARLIHIEPKLSAGSVALNTSSMYLGQAVGLSRDDVTSLRFVAPASRFAVDAYVNFARQQPWQEAVASSLTELFAPHIHQQRIDTWPEQYPWVDPTGLQYFKNRLTQARRDVAHGLTFTLKYFSQTRALQERALDILQFKLNVLWALADAIMLDQCQIEITGPKA